jgi:HNH endonuclease/NUMOD4 motif
MSNATPEEWRPIPDWGDLYEASDRGRVRRIVGRNGRGWYDRITIRKLRVGKQGYYTVQLWRDCKPTTMMVHRLVAQAFIGPRPDGLEIRHLNDNKLDNRLVNLVYGTRSENKKDSVRNGIHPMTRRTRCPSGHEYTPENTYWKPRKGKPPQRVCIKCTRNGIKPGAFNRNKTYCPKKHEYTPENTFVNSKGSRECRTCLRERRASRTKH